MKEKKRHPPVDAMLRALRLITKNNILRLGDSHWIQLKGTAIGTPPAPTYNKFFYGVFELFPIEIFGNNLLLHRQLLEDVMAIWKRYDKEHNAVELWDFQ